MQYVYSYVYNLSQYTSSSIKTLWVALFLNKRNHSRRNLQMSTIFLLRLWIDLDRVLQREAYAADEYFSGRPLISS